METRQVDELIWREDLYPRFEPDPATIQKYAKDVELLPPVEINQHNELIDGYHRWTAHKKAEVETIEVIVTETESDREFARIAMRRNAKHGLHIKNAEKKAWLLKWYAGLNQDEKKELASDMGVSISTVNGWTTDKDKTLRAQRRQKAFNLWLACWTFEEIGEELDKDKTTISEWIDKNCREITNLEKPNIFAYHRDGQWNPPLTDVWTTSKKSNKISHFGNSEASFFDNLLYLYTNPFDIVIDPFAGGGATVDVCKHRLRRYYVSDRLPIVERLDIREHDILDGPPSMATRWSDVKLIFLDPPYWKQSEGQYSDDIQDLANMGLDEFHNTLTQFILQCVDKLHDGAHIAMLLQPTKWKAPNKKSIHHPTIIRSNLLDCKQLELQEIFQAPYSTQQINPQMTNWAKENKSINVIGRTITVWKVAK